MWPMWTLPNQCGIRRRYIELGISRGRKSIVAIVERISVRANFQRTAIYEYTRQYSAPPRRRLWHRFGIYGHNSVQGRIVGLGCQRRRPAAALEEETNLRPFDSGYQKQPQSLLSCSRCTLSNPSGEKVRLVGPEPTKTVPSTASVFVLMIAIVFWDGIVAYI